MFTLPDFATPANATEAIQIQKALASRVEVQNRFDRLELIAGVDVSYHLKDNLSYGVIVLMKAGELKPLTIIRSVLETRFPYISGLLSFREIPVLLEAFRQLPIMPDIIMVDGHGVAHPRRLGIAAHLGVLLDIPAIGVAKSRLTGEYREPGTTKGDHSLLMSGTEQIGTVLRSKERTKPLFISPGHRMDHKTALDFTLACLMRYRLPEPTRIADKISKERPFLTSDTLL